MKLFLPIIDNGMGLSRTSWGLSLASVCLSVLRWHEVSLCSISYPYPDGAMNIASHRFEASGCEEMLLIGTDLTFTPNHVAWLLEHKEPLVFGGYPKKIPGLHFPMEFLTEENPFGRGGEIPLVEVKRTARGFMRMHRSVLERMADSVPLVPLFTSTGTMRQYWQTLPGGHSEDYNFCDRWRALGGRVLVDKRITAQHEGTAVYPIPGTF